MPRAGFWVAADLKKKQAIGVVALAAALATSVVLTAFFAGFVWPQTATGDPDVRFMAGHADDFAVHEPVFFQEHLFWLVKEPDGSFIALYAKDPHLGCTVPWRPQFDFVDPRDGERKEGWFRNPCHGETYDIHGTRMFGPTPRSLDRYPVYLDGDKVTVRAGEDDLVKGGPGYSGPLRGLQ